MSLGFVLGKFYPLHKGHIYLIEEARKQVDELIILIGSLKNETISGEIRFAWLKKTFPDLEIHHIKDENPQFPEEHKNFWEIWKKSIESKISKKIDCVISSEDYGEPLAKLFNAKSILIDKDRKKFPISGTEIRSKPTQYWDYLSEEAKPYFVKKIVLYGPESTGKTTLAKYLAEYFQTIWIPEFARVYLEEKNKSVEPDDISIIAKGQMKYEDEAVFRSNKFLFCDTDILVTKVYSEHYYNFCPEFLKEECKNRNYFLHLLTNNDIPHVADPLRDRADRREEMFRLFENEILLANRKFERIIGNFEERKKQSIEIISRI
jgi:HTH-type transcriptional regulator, transcriptional repressor of NAD biosynthesis genes